MFLFKTSSSADYASRTNITASADVTFAFAVDFNTRGEKLTRKLVNSHGKLYNALNIPKKGVLDINEIDFEYIYNSVKFYIEENELKSYSINIAGNGLYTLIQYGITQNSIDNYIFQFLDTYTKIINTPIEFIISGGQSGVDEAGSKAAHKLGFKSLIYAPKNFKFRNIHGIDIYNEQEFKSRFNVD